MLWRHLLVERFSRPHPTPLTYRPVRRPRPRKGAVGLHGEPLRQLGPFYVLAGQRPPSRDRQGRCPPRGQPRVCRGCSLFRGCRKDRAQRSPWNPLPPREGVPTSGGPTPGLTFLRDADRPAAHAHAQRVHASVDEVLCLGRCHHCASSRGESRGTLRCPSNGGPHPKTSQAPRAEDPCPSDGMGRPR